MKPDTRAETADRPKSRQVSCERCGRTFACGVGGDCWCAAEPYQLPVPTDGSDCLCPDCLRRVAAEQA